MVGESIKYMHLHNPLARAWVDCAGLGAKSAEHAGQLLLAILIAPPADMFKDDRSRVWAVTVQDHQWVLKQIKLRGWACMPCALARPVLELRREWNAARRLNRMGIRTSTPVALLRTMTDTVLVMPRVDGPNLYHVLEGDNVAKLSAQRRRWRRQLAQLIGQQIGTMVRHGWVNRDHKVGNIIVDQTCSPPMPVLIDPGGLRRCRSQRQVIDVMAHLYRTATTAGRVNAGECAACVKGLAEAMDGGGHWKQMFEAVRRRVRNGR